MMPKLRRLEELALYLAAGARDQTRADLLALQRVGDRVVVMSSRPGRIADIVTDDLPRPRGAHTRSDARFVEHVERIRRHFLALGVLSET